MALYVGKLYVPTLKYHIMLNSILLAFALLIGNPSEGIETYTVNAEDSKISWVGSKVGGSHNGFISVKEGRLDLENGVINGGSFVIDMTTLTDEDLSGEYKQKLEGHLKSDDFFGVENFPTASFQITRAVPQGPGKYKIEGDITIKGITKSIKFPAEVSSDNDIITANANITIDRSEFDVKYGSGSFFDNLGDKVIYDDFTLDVTLKASK